jgi:hypothetical protein
VGLVAGPVLMAASGEASRHSGSLGVMLLVLVLHLLVLLVGHEQ